MVLLLGLTIIFKTLKMNKETSRNYHKTITKSLGGYKQLLRAFCSNTGECMLYGMLFYYYFSIAYSHKICCKGPLFPTDVLFSLICKRSWLKKLHFLASLTRANLTNKD